MFVDVLSAFTQMGGGLALGGTQWSFMGPYAPGHYLKQFLPKFAGQDFPVLAGYYLDGLLDLDAMVTKTIGLDDVEAAFEDMAAGRVIRSVIVFD